MENLFTVVLAGIGSLFLGSKIYKFLEVILGVFIIPGLPVGTNSFSKHEHLTDIWLLASKIWCQRQLGSRHRGI